MANCAVAPPCRNSTLYSPGTPRSCRRSASACSAIETNSLPRWLISITDMPDPRQSSISSRACASTSSGNTAGPALKLKTLPTAPFPLVLKGRVRRLASARRVVDLAFPACVVSHGTVAVLCVFVVAVGDFLETGQSFLRTQVDQRHALGGAAHLAHLVDPRADQHAAGRNQHDLVVLIDQRSGHDLAVALGGLDRDHA